jgi:hypothetical protein
LHVDISLDYGIPQGQTSSSPCSLLLAICYLL